VTLGATYADWADHVGIAGIPAALLGWWHSAPLPQALHELGVPLGRVLSDAVNAAIARHMPR
jgi:hypothetical protein